MPKPFIRPNFAQIIFYEFFMKEQHFLHILADFHEKIIKKKRFIKFSKRFGTFEKIDI